MKGKAYWVQKLRSMRMRRMLSALVIVRSVCQRSYYEIMHIATPGSTSAWPK